MTLLKKIFGFLHKETKKKTKVKTETLRVKHQRVRNSEIKEAKKLRKLGMRPVDISKKLGISEAVVSYHTKKQYKYVPVNQRPVEKQIRKLRYNHEKKIPVYHERCPCGLISGIPQDKNTLEDWKKRSAMARSDRITTFRRNLLASKKSIHYKPDDKTLLSETSQTSIPTRKELLQREL